MATQPITSPSKLIDPAIASTARSAGAAVKLRCVSSRWKPTVTPSPVITEKATASRMSARFKP
jgi:hypothetical protein